MEENNFKKLEEEMEAKFSDSTDKVKANVNGQRGFWTLLGDLFELYIPKVFGAIIGGTSYNSSLMDKKSSDTKESEH